MPPIKGQEIIESEPCLAVSIIKPINFIKDKINKTKNLVPHKFLIKIDDCFLLTSYSYTNIRYYKLAKNLYSKNLTNLRSYKLKWYGLYKIKITNLKKRVEYYQ